MAPWYKQGFSTGRSEAGRGGVRRTTWADILLSDTGVLLAAVNAKGHYHDAYVALMLSTEGPLLVPSPPAKRAQGGQGRPPPMPSVRVPARRRSESEHAVAYPTPAGILVAAIVLMAPAMIGPCRVR